MARQIINRAASIKQKLMTLAREQNRVYEVVLVRYALERILYRLSISEHRNKFVLKGGMLVTLCLENSNRETRDVDFLGYGSADPEHLKEIFRNIFAMPADDGLVFDFNNLTTTAIREEAEYGGIRLRTIAFLEKSQIPVIIDIGFGDALLPSAQALEYPSMLGMETPSINTYPPAMVVAEKFQAMVALGVINGRMKDYFDLWAISQSVHIAASDLDMAIGATFARRKTEIPKTRPPGLSEFVLRDATKQGQWRAYASSINLTNTAFDEILEGIWGLVGPSCARLCNI
jgi:hypothetical protein